MKLKEIIVIATIITSTFACSNKFKSPEVELPDHYNYNSSGSTHSSVNSKWWEIFGDTTLNRLITFALDNNQDVNIAYHKVEQSKLNYRVKRADYLPSISVTASGERLYNMIESKYSEYIVEPAVSWEISLFGAMRNSSLAARAAILSNEYNRRAVMLALAAEVASDYFTLIEYRRSLEISRTTYNSRVKSMAIIDSMVQYGISTSLDYEQALGLTMVAESNISKYERLISDCEGSLSLLLGEYPHAIASSDHFCECYNDLPPTIPAGLPSELLSRRPDIQIAYADLLSASANIGIAQAARFPSIAITADGGLMSGTLKSLVSSNPYATAWNTLLSITQPIFQFGKLKNNHLIAKKEFDIAELNYRKTIYSAINDVESALVAIETYRKESDKYEALVESNKKVKYFTSELYRIGMVDYLNYLDAERSLYSSELEQTSLITAQYSSYIALYKALGGGW